VGSFVSDYHGVISHPDFAFDPRQLLRACGLVAWDFNHIPASQSCFAPFHREQHRSPVIDLSAGYDAYVKERREAGTEQIKKNRNLMRRLEREVGPLRFVAHSPDKALLNQLLAWKTEQFRHNRWRDLFSIPWVRKTMEGIHTTQTPEFAGMLSLLYAGDQLVAAHFGMRSATVWHYWFPSYDPAFSKYSPGVMLLLAMAETAASMGIKTIDLGCGEHSYKWRLMNGFVLTASGSVELIGPATLARRIWIPVRELPFKTRSLVGKTPIGALARRIRYGASRNCDL
jgi:CelD/BcsL family acetyltransferase involved in cellulose biosynthesis